MEYRLCIDVECFLKAKVCSVDKSLCIFMGYLRSIHYEGKTSKQQHGTTHRAESSTELSVLQHRLLLS
jgi:hypothetical protein